MRAGPDKALNIGLTVTDASGLSETVSTTIFANRAPIGVDSTPCGFTARFGPGEIGRKTPASYSALIGQDFTLGFQDADTAGVCIGNQFYDFLRWSDDTSVPPVIGSTRTISIPAGFTYLAAEFVATVGVMQCDPPYANNLSLHLVASDGVATSGNDVDSWADQVGGHSLSAVAADSTRPTFTTATTGIDDQPSIHFDGTNDVLERVGAVNELPVGDEHRTTIMVVKYDSNGWGGFTYGPTLAGLSDNKTFGLAVDGGGNLAIQGWGTADNPTTTQGNGQGWMIHSVSRFGTTDASGNPIEITRHYKDGVSIDGDIAHTWDTDDAEIRLGAKFDGSTHVAMDVAEILVYDVGLSETARTYVENFLREKYFVTGDPPAPQSDMAQVRPGRTVTIAVLDNDCDPDGTLNPASVVIPPPLPAHGTVSVAGGVVTYEHDPSGANSEADQFYYTVADNDGNVSNPTLVTIRAECPSFNCNETIFVKGGSGSPGDGESWNTAFEHLPDALAVACAGDEIWVTAGTYLPTGSAAQPSRSDSFHLVNGVALYGGFDGTETTRDERSIEANETILSGDLLGNDDDDLPFNPLTSENSYHVINANGAESTTILDGFTVRSGNADDTTPDSLDGFGGGILIDGDDPVRDSGSPTVRNCVFKFNNALSGGSVSTTGGSPRFRDCSFITNQARDFGGSIYAMGGESVPLFSEAEFVNCRFVNNNVTAGDGGAVYAEDSAPTMVGCEFTRNTAALGGAVSIRCGANCTRPATFVNCTIASNDADEGGGIYIDSAGSTEVRNTILWANTGEELDTLSDQIALSPGTIIDVKYSCVQDDDPGLGPPPFGDPSNIDDEPTFVQLLAGNVRVMKGSPTIDVGSDAFLNGSFSEVTVDRDGSLRLFDDPDVTSTELVDMGSYEAGHPAIVPGRDGFSFGRYGYSFFIDPRQESSNGSALDLGLGEITLVFTEQVRDVGGTGDVPTAAAFSITYVSGASNPPVIRSTLDCVVPVGFPSGDPCASYNDPATDDDAGYHVVTLVFDDDSLPVETDEHLKVGEWLSIVASVESLDGRRISGSDRVFIGFLPGPAHIKPLSK